ncbi:hypothetical protein KFE98_14590 [bacterium SCSIO 12741]|nr:hypothetical protein KFE98_14590 [bacterium SCSIO 12741]
MREIINTLFGALFGISSVAGMGLIAVILYPALPEWLAILVTIVLLGLGGWIGIIIFRKVEAIGLLEFYTASKATPNLDHLEVGPNSETKKRTPQEWVQLINEQKQLFKGGSIRIFNDWFGKPHHNHHVLVSASFDSKEQILTINFDSGEVISIYQPEPIFESTTFLKVLRANRIKLSWYKYGKPQTKENHYYINYQKKGKHIEVTTDYNFGTTRFNASVGYPALMIYG